MNLANHDNQTPLSLALSSKNELILEMVRKQFDIDANSTTKEAD